MAKHQVVIIGGGFGGLYAAKGLIAERDVCVTLIDRRNFHLFQPLLYQVATGGLSPGDIAAPLRAEFRKNKNVRVILGEVIGFDVKRKMVLMTDGECAYDTLVLAAGSQTSYFGNDRWQTFAPGLKTVEEATEIRHRILFAFEQAEKTQDAEERKSWLTFVVVGAGATGVELAGTLGEIANDTLRDDFRSFRPSDAQIFLLDGNDRVLPTYPPDLSHSAQEQLRELSVRFLPKVRVTDVREDGITMHTGDGEQTMATRTVIWAAGVVANPLGKEIASVTGIQTDKRGLVPVEPDCTLKGYPEIFVIGDLALFTHQEGFKALPGVAPTAIQMGEYTARAIRDRLHGRTVKAFQYWDKGSLATIGRNRAVADLHVLRFGGWLAWLAWLAVHLLYLVGFENRFLVVLQWGINYVTFNRGARLITGAGRMMQKRPIADGSPNVPAA